MRAVARSHAQKTILDEAMEKQYAQDYQVISTILIMQDTARKERS